jgi:predicted ester cyclase
VVWYFNSKNGLVIVGTHTGEFMGIPPTGKDVCVRMTAFDKIENGKLCSSEVIVDVAGLLVQLGVMPPPKGF